MLLGLGCHSAGFRKPEKKDAKNMFVCVYVKGNVENRKSRSEYSKDLFYLYFNFLFKVLMKRGRKHPSSSPTFGNKNLSHNYTYLPFATLFLWENSF